jgi:anti-sigma-K factor RskA
MRPDIHTLTGAYAVDALPEDERRVFEAHLAACETCAQEVAELQATAARLGAIEHEVPPPDLKSRVMAEIDRTRQVRPLQPVTRPQGPAGRRWPYGLLGAAAAVLLVAVAALGVVVADLSDRLEQLDTSSQRVADVLTAADARTIGVEGPDGTVVRVVMSEGRGEAVFLAAGMDPAPDDHAYGLWTIHDDVRVAAGLFDVDDQGQATRVLTGDMATVTAIGVTIEPAGGSLQPTSDPVMLIEVAG